MFRFMRSKQQIHECLVSIQNPATAIHNSAAAQHVFSYHVLNHRYHDLLRDPVPLLQLFTLSIFIFILACVGVFYPYNRGGLFTALIVLYALTASISGYMAASYYTQMEGTQWVRNILLTCITFCGPLFLTFCFNNTVAIVYRVSHVVCLRPSADAGPLAGHVLLHLWLLHRCRVSAAVSLTQNKPFIHDVLYSGSQLWLLSALLLAAVLSFLAALY